MNRNVMRALCALVCASLFVTALAAPSVAAEEDACEAALDKLTGAIARSGGGGSGGVPAEVVEALGEAGDACPRESTSSPSSSGPGPDEWDVMDATWLTRWADNPQGLALSATSVQCRKSSLQIANGTASLTIFVDDQAPVTYTDNLKRGLVDFNPARLRTTFYMGMTDSFGMDAWNGVPALGTIYITTEDITGVEPVALPADSADAKAWCLKPNTDVCRGWGWAGYEAPRLKIGVVSELRYRAC